MQNLKTLLKRVFLRRVLFKRNHKTMSLEFVTFFYHHISPNTLSFSLHHIWEVRFADIRNPQAPTLYTLETRILYHLDKRRMALVSLVSHGKLGRNK